MRRGMTGAEIRLIPEGKLESVNLGADFTAEHEWGIAGLKRSFGLNDSAKPGIPRLKVSIAPGKELLRLIHEKDSSIVDFSPFVYSGSAHDKPSHELDFLKPWRDETPAELVGAWSEQDFGVRFRNHTYADDLYEAFQRKDVAFLFGNTKGNPFSNAGLVLAIVSRLPMELIEGLADQASDADRLKKAAEKTGIAARLKKASEKSGITSYPRPFTYYALSPRWKDETKKEVIFWLNPCNQDKINFGWFTVKDLDEWIAGTGKVPKHDK